MLPRMRMAAWIAGVALAAGLAVGGTLPAEAGGPWRTSVVRSESEMSATTERPATGSFSFVEKVTRAGREKASYVIEATGLDASRLPDGRRAPHGAYLLPPGGGEVFLGALTVDGKGRGRLAKRNAGGILGESATPLRRQAGATVEVRGPQGTVLRGALPAFALDESGATSDRRETYGLFVRVSSAAPTSSPGRFAFRTDELASGEIRNRAVIESGSLSADSVYGVYLFGPRIVSLGIMENHPRLGATLSLDSRREGIPGGIVRWSEFDGGTIEIRRGSTTFFRGAITIFRAASERVEDTGWARSRATVELAPTAAGGDARGLLTAAVTTHPRRREQEVRVRAFDLPTSGMPYVIETIEPDGVRQRLGTLYVRGDAGAGAFRLSTRKGDRTPPGGVLGQSARPVEVVSSAGAVVLTGTFPTLD